MGIRIENGQQVVAVKTAGIKPSVERSINRFNRDTIAYIVLILGCQLGRRLYDGTIKKSGKIRYWSCQRQVLKPLKKQL